jgi:DNA-binding PadR family transcriptional regulator
VAVGRHRFFRYGELPLVLLALLEREQVGGYELMGELDRLFGPDYRPSPGSVYPALKALAAEELVEVVDGNGAAVYRPTPAGRRVLTDRRDDLAVIEHRTGRRLVGGDAIEAALAQLRARVTAVVGRASEDLVIAALEGVAARIERAAEEHVRDHVQDRERQRT